MTFESFEIFPSDEPPGGNLETLLSHGKKWPLGGGNHRVLFSVERNTIKLEGNACPGDPSIQAKVNQEIEYTEAFLKAGLPISITCYVGGTRCTKQAEMISALLKRNLGYAPLITPHITCNFSPEDTYEYLQALQSQGIDHLLCLSGDTLDSSFKAFTRDSRLRKAPQLVNMVRLVGLKGKANGLGKNHFETTEPTVAYSPFNGANPLTEQRKFDEKLCAGARSVKTQPVTYADSALINRDLTFLSSRIPESRIGFSVIYYQSVPMAENIETKFRIKVPQEVLNRLRYQEWAGKSDGTSKARVLTEGLRIAAQSIAYLIYSGVQNVNIMGVRKPRTFEKLLECVPGYVEAYAGQSSVAQDHQTGKELAAVNM